VLLQLRGVCWLRRTRPERTHTLSPHTQTLSSVLASEIKHEQTAYEQDELVAKGGRWRAHTHTRDTISVTA
jgi:hypothetical protein